VVRVTLRTLQFSRSREVLILTECPACGYDFSPNESRDLHIADHDPEDFGLTPLGETSDHQRPLFEDVDDLSDLTPDKGPEFNRVDAQEAQEARR